MYLRLKVYKMDSVTIVIGAVLLLLCVVFYVLNINSKKKKERQMLQILEGVAGSADCRISKYDILNHAIIGFDESSKSVLVSRNVAGEESSQIINLGEIQRCRVAELRRSVGTKEGTIKAFDRIDLVFVNKNKNKPDVSVEFYNATIDRLTLAGELQLADKWCKIVTEQIVPF